MEAHKTMDSLLSFYMELERNPRSKLGGPVNFFSKK